ncbi:MAG TPA: hypothetical protein PKV82_09990, partial [Anaerolineae bacterium]|nr:hypothetical protein [Anaerolineae bacterium]
IIFQALFNVKQKSWNEPCSITPKKNCPLKSAIWAKTSNHASLCAVLAIFPDRTRGRAGGLLIQRRIVL